MKPRKTPIAVCLTLVLCGADALAVADPIETDWQRCRTFDPDTGEQQIDAIEFFQMLIERYHQLKAYEDVAKVVQVTTKSGQIPKRVETMIGCEIEDGELRIQTPASQVRKSLGLDASFRRSSAVESTAEDFGIWLAPHMALKFAEQPEQEIRPGVKETFTATEAMAVTIDEKPMVHLELTSGNGDQEDASATLDLYVDPESMLVERIEGQQRLPDGAQYETTLQIQPIHSQIVDEPEEIDEPPVGTEDLPQDDSPQEGPPDTDPLSEETIPPKDDSGVLPDDPIDPMPRSVDSDLSGDPKKPGSVTEDDAKPAAKPDSPPITPPGETIGLN